MYRSSVHGTYVAVVHKGTDVMYILCTEQYSLVLFYAVLHTGLLYQEFLTSTRTLRATDPSKDVKLVHTCCPNSSMTKKIKYSDRKRLSKFSYRQRYCYIGPDPYLTVNPCGVYFCIAYILLL
jgi:hypothetical protein